MPERGVTSSAGVNVVSESETLHERVRAFAAAPAQAHEFDALALDIAAFQARWSAGFRRLLERHGRTPSSASDIPAVPAAAFRTTRVAVHPPALDELRFVSSGTTAEQRSTHAFRTTATYRALATRFGRRMLLTRAARRAVVVALAPRPVAPPASSLTFMMQAFMEDFDGRGIDTEGFTPDARERWLIGANAVDIGALRRAAQVARERREPLIVLATSLALLALLERLAAPIDAPEGSIVMQTGGFKGRTVSVDVRELRQRAARCFGIGPDSVIAEYGMTELSSQLYEQAATGRYAAPHWLRVTAVDPITLDELPAGEVGLARFVDLANVDSAVAVVTDDLIRRSGEAVELIGRRTGAPARGCSLALESLLLTSPSA